MKADELDVSAVSHGASRLRLRVKPGARRDAVEGGHGGALKVSVTAPPEKGRANRAVERLLAEALGIPVSSVRIVSGQISRDKIAEIASIKAEELKVRLSRLSVP